MSETDVRNPLLKLVRVGGLTIVFVVMALAFIGMGLFMWNMGRDMSMMTTSVVQMGKDVTLMSMVQGQARMGDDFSRVRAGMESMTVNMGNMSHDMSALNENIAGMTTQIHNMSVDMRQMNHSMAVMTNSMGHMGSDINKFSNPQRMLPFVP